MPQKFDMKIYWNELVHMVTSSKESLRLRKEVTTTTQEEETICFYRHNVDQGA